MDPDSNTISSTRTIEPEPDEHMPPEKFQRRTHEDDVSVVRSKSRRKLVSTSTAPRNVKGHQSGIGTRERPLPPLPQPTTCASTPSSPVPQEMVIDSNPEDVQAPGEEGPRSPSILTLGQPEVLPSSGSFQILQSQTHEGYSSLVADQEQPHDPLETERPSADGQSYYPPQPQSQPMEQRSHEHVNSSSTFAQSPNNVTTEENSPQFHPIGEGRYPVRQLPQRLISSQNSLASIDEVYSQLTQTTPHLSRVGVMPELSNRSGAGPSIPPLTRTSNPYPRVHSVDSTVTQQQTDTFFKQSQGQASGPKTLKRRKVPESPANQHVYDQQQSMNYQYPLAAHEQHPSVNYQYPLVPSQLLVPSQPWAGSQGNAGWSQRSTGPQYTQQQANNSLSGHPYISSHLPQPRNEFIQSPESNPRFTEQQTQIHSNTRSDQTAFIPRQPTHPYVLQEGHPISTGGAMPPPNPGPSQTQVPGRRHQLQNLSQSNWHIQTPRIQPGLQPLPSQAYPHQKDYDMRVVPPENGDKGGPSHNGHTNYFYQRDHDMRSAPQSNGDKGGPSYNGRTPHPHQEDYDMHIVSSENGDEGGPSHNGRATYSHQKDYDMHIAPNGDDGRPSPKKNARKDKGKQKANDRHRNHHDHQGPNQPPPPPPFTMDTGDFMDHWTGMFNNMFTTMQDGMMAQQAAFQLYEARMDAKLEAFVENIARNKKPRKSGARAEENQDEGTDADDESGYEDARHERDPDVVRLRDYVRAHLKALLNLQALNHNNLSELLPPLTEQEIALFDSGHENAPDPPTVASGQFRIDFSRGMRKCKYNAVAKREFIQHFLDAVHHGSYTEKGVIPTRLRTEEMIGTCLETTIKYIRGIFKNHGITYSPQRNAQGMRRDTLALSRRRACSQRGGGFVRHIMPGGIFQPPGRAKPMKREMMSGDETDSPGPPKVYRILRPEWQSDALATFFWRLDEIDREHWRQPVTTRATSGNAPRLRIHSTKPRVTTKAPHGLWRNCYHPAFLAKLRPWQIRDLDIIDDDYDFSINPADQ